MSEKFTSATLYFTAGSNAAFLARPQYLHGAHDIPATECTMVGRLDGLQRPRCSRFYWRFLSRRRILRPDLDLEHY
jgi:hypothetical protein